MIIQSIALLDQMDKDINTFAMRVREWYSWHFPELKNVVKDNFIFAQCAAYIKVENKLQTVVTSLFELYFCYCYFVSTFFTSLFLIFYVYLFIYVFFRTRPA